MKVLKHNAGILFIISAPSGTGKTTVVKQVCDQLRDICKLKRIVTYTTKKPRAGEVDGHDYHFISVDQFRKKIADQFFLEWSTAYGNYYGCPSTLLEDIEQGISCIAILDQNGAQSVARLIPGVVLVWLYPPNIQTLNDRLLLRNTENKMQQKKRLEIAQKELSDDRLALYDFHVLNDSQEHCIQELKLIILRSLGHG